jgi:hypothetical protein
MAKKQPYHYGQSPHPKNWHETVDALKSLKTKPKRPGFHDRLDQIEQLIKERKS